MRLLLALSLFTLPVAVAAQQQPDPSALGEAERDELGRLFKRAQAAYEAKNYLESIEALRAAHNIFPEPNILYRIGDAYENLGDLRNAADFYRKYVEAAPTASDAGLVRRRLEDLDRRIAELEQSLQPTKPERAALLLDTNPAGAVVSLDNKPVDGETPVRVELAPGSHRVELVRPGFEPVVREIEVGAGETISLVYQLEAVPVAPKRQSPLPWIVGGTGLVSLGASVGLLLGARSAQKQVEAWDDARLQAYEDGGEVLQRPPDYDATVRREATFRTTGYVVGGVGAAAVVGGVLWLLLRGSGDDSVAIGFDGDTVSVSASVRF